MQFLLTKKKTVPHCIILQVKLFRPEKALLVPVWFSAPFYTTLLLKFAELFQNIFSSVATPVYFSLVSRVIIPVLSAASAQGARLTQLFQNNSCQEEQTALSNFFFLFAILDFYSEVPEQIRSQFILHDYFRTYLSHRTWPKIISQICLE